MKISNSSVTMIFFIIGWGSESKIGRFLRLDLSSGRPKYIDHDHQRFSKKGQKKTGKIEASRSSLLRLWQLDWFFVYPLPSLCRFVETSNHLKLWIAKSSSHVIFWNQNEKVDNQTLWLVSNVPFEHVVSASIWNGRYRGLLFSQSTDSRLAVDPLVKRPPSYNGA